MRVTIEHFQTVWEGGGVFSRKRYPRYGIRCRILFSEEELAIIKSLKLQDAVLYVIPHAETPAGVTMPNLSPQDYPVTLGQVVKAGGCERTFDSPAGAQQWEIELQEKVLPQLRAYFDYHTEQKQPKTFEL